MRAKSTTCAAMMAICCSRIGAALRAQAHLRRVDGDGERRAPAAQRLHDGAQFEDHHARPLVAGAAADAADGAAVEIGPRVLAHLLDVVERVLDQPGDGAVIAGRGEDDAVGLPQEIAETFGFIALGAEARIVIGKGELRPGDERGARAAGFGAPQRQRQGAFGGGAAAQRAADADDEGLMAQRWAHVASLPVFIGVTATAAPSGRRRLLTNGIYRIEFRIT